MNERLLANQRQCSPVSGNTVTSSDCWVHDSRHVLCYLHDWWHPEAEPCGYCAAPDPPAAQIVDLFDALKRAL